jgi:hypothetical protein
VACWCRLQINLGTYDGTADVNVIANLIKVWFRECPTAAFDGLTESFMLRVNSLATSAEVRERAWQPQQLQASQGQAGPPGIQNSPSMI